jgi:Ca2+-binding RTX toxin-like protein
MEGTMAPDASINPSQGLNLGGQPGAYGDTFNAIDLFKGADAWITFDAQGNEIRNAVAVDSKGWMTDIPVINGEPATVVVNVFYTQIVPSGSYIVEWTGEGDLTTYTNYEVIGPNKIRVNYTADYSNGDNGLSLVINSTDPNNTGNYIRDIKVYQEKYSDLIAMGEKFDPEWFQAVDDFRVLRTHDWQGTNFSKVTDWTTNVETADQAFWVRDGRGMPYELLVEMANETRSDLWINIPHLATDDYMKKAAEYVKANLDPDLRVYVEYTNEYWTTIFDQHPYLIQQGAQKFGNAPFANAQAYGARASEMTQIFKDVFGADGARLYPTVTLNHGAFNTEEAITMLTTPAYAAQGGKSPLEAGIRHLATDGYLYWGGTDPATAALIDSWLDDPDKGYGAARDYLIAQLNDDLAPAWVKGRALADINNLSFGVYEGGALLLNGRYNDPGPARFTQFNKDVQLSAEMRQVYEATLAAWQSTGSGPFAWYSDTGRAGPEGDYGLWNAPDFKPELRTEAIIAANQNVDPWWTGDTRPASTFDNGIYDAGTEAADVMTGTRMEDRLYGLPGDDKLSGLGGVDRLVGGKGIDMAYGGDGNDALYGGDGNDRWLGGDAGDDMVFGDAGDDRMDGAAGLDTLYGGAGSDYITAGADADTLYGGDETGAGDSWLGGDGGNDTVFGNAGNDRMDGAAGLDMLYGGAGSDYITAGADADTLYGGDETGAGDSWLGGDAGSDTIYGGLGNDRIDGGADNDTWLGGDAGADYITGGLGNDRLDGGADNDSWLGGDAGIDYITGGPGNDRIDGGADNDSWLGGDAGADYITGGVGNDRLDGGADNDSWLGGDAGSDYITGGSGNDRLDGGTENDSLYGGDGGDYMTAGDGDDYLDGGAASDSLFGGAGLDVFDFNPGSAIDTVYGFVNDVDTLRIDSAYGFANIAAVIAATSMSGNHAFVNLGGGNGAILLNWISSGNTIAQLADDIVIV